MDKKGQGSIEYLLIIGAAILVVAVVIIALVSISQTATEGADGDEAAQAQQMQKCQVQCGISGGDWNSVKNKCSVTIPTTDDLDCTSYNNN